MLRSFLMSGVFKEIAPYTAETVPHLRRQRFTNPTIPSRRVISDANQRLLDHGQFTSPAHGQKRGRPRLAVELLKDDTIYFC